MHNLVFAYIKENRSKILNEWVDRMKNDSDDRLIRIVSDQMFMETSNQFIDLIVSNVKESHEDFTVKLNDFAEKVVRLGWPLSFVITGLKVFNLIVFESMAEEGIINEKNHISLMRDFENWSIPMNTEVINMYTSTWERTVSLQKIALQELSAPLIPVLEGITIMPLVGTIDTERAKQIMENLLTGVVKHRSEVVLIDITGVPLVDTMVAHHIIQASEAVRLVGATCMLCGIRPEIAQTIVNLGINLNEIITKNTLKRGFEAALVLTNRKIVGVEAEEV
ncbi:MAG: RsbT co-antagonist protein RsbRA [Bacillus sp. (in: firmicutes)]